MAGHGLAVRRFRKKGVIMQIKRLIVLLICLCLSLTALFGCEKAPTHSLPGDEELDVSYANKITAENPLIWSDVPDPDVIRVGDTYYMVSTTMYYTPGVPIMRSYDLVNWELIGYVYDTLEDSQQTELFGDSHTLRQRLVGGKHKISRGDVLCPVLCMGPGQILYL